MDLDDAIARFETQLRADGRSPHTIASYLRDLVLLAGWLRSSGRPVDVAEIAPEDLAAFTTSEVVTCKADGARKAPGSIQKVKVSLKAFFSILVGVEVLPVSPARLWRSGGRRERVAPEILTGGEQEMLLLIVESASGATAARDVVILELLLLTGLRLGSLVALDVEDVRLSERRLIVRKLKGGGQSRKVIPARLRRRLEGYLVERGGIDGECPALFLSNRGTRLSRRQVEHLVAGWIARAGIEKKVSVHTLRHSFATHLYRRTRDLLVVQRALDHRQVTTTQCYAQVSDEDLEAALESL